MIEEHGKKSSRKLNQEEEEQEVCCDENTPCVPSDTNEDHDEKVNYSIEKMMSIVDTINNNTDYIDSHKGENRHSKNIDEQSKEIEKEPDKLYIP